MHHFARNECLPQHADTSLLLKVLHKAEVLLFYVVALSERGGWTETQTTPSVLLVLLGWAGLCWHHDQESPGAQCCPSVTCQVGVFDSKGTVMSHPGPEFEPHLKSQWFKTTRSGNTIWLSLFLERDFFSPQFPFPIKGLISI